MLGRHLKNIYDHRLPDAEAMMSYDYDDWAKGPDAMHAAWQRYLDWINANVVGPPRATEIYSREDLERMHMIGIYAPPV